MNTSPSGAAFPSWDGGDTELEWADVNGDGNIDLLSVGDHGSPYINTSEHGIMVYFTDGNLGWSIHQEGNFGYGGIAIGDVNNDGLLDAGYAVHHNYSGSDFGDQLIEVALGDGTGTAWTPWDDGLGQNGEDWGMFATDFADMDNDGDLDLASNSFGCCNGVHVYRNNGDGTWTQTWTLSGGNSQQYLCFGDVNGDGFSDIAASYQNGTIFLGDGEGGFTSGDAGLPSAGTLGIRGVSLGDVDGDGCADVAFNQSGGVFVYLWRGDHWESSSTGLPASGSYAATQLWDMNADGFVDVAALGGGTCTVWLGDGAGGWSPGGGFYHGPSTDTAAFRVGGDLDHNGYPDVALVQEEGSYPSYLNHLYVYRESSTPAERFVVFQFPRGNEAFHFGSVMTVRWSAARVGLSPASMDLELSTSGPDGPWLPVASGLPDNGHFQWTVAGAITDAAHLRLTLRQGTETAVAVSRAFRILSSDPAAVAEPGDGSGSGALAGGAAPGAFALPRVAAFPNPAAGWVRLRIEGGDGAAAFVEGGGEDDAAALGEGASGARTGAFGNGVRRAAITVRDITGRLVRVLSPAGTETAWEGTDARGRKLPQGIYLIGLERDGRAGPVSRLALIR